MLRTEHWTVTALAINGTRAQHTVTTHYCDDVSVPGFELWYATAPKLDSGIARRSPELAVASLLLDRQLVAVRMERTG